MGRKPKLTDHQKREAILGASSWGGFRFGGGLLWCGWSGGEVHIEVVGGVLGCGVGGCDGGSERGESGGLLGRRLLHDGEKVGELEPGEKFFEALFVEVGDAGGLVDAGEPADVGVGPEGVGADGVQCCGAG